MVETIRARRPWAYGVMAVLSVMVALFSFRFAAVPFGRWPQIDPGIQGVLRHVPIRGLAHMLASPVALLVGPFQFWTTLRNRRPGLHRALGRIYVVACVIGGVAGLATAPYASGGGIAATGFGLLAVCWLATTLGAWRAATQRRFTLHRLLMRFSFAMTFGAVTLRLQIPLGFALGSPSYSAMSIWLAWTAWLPNVAVVAAYSWWEGLASGAPSRLAAGQEGRISP